MYQRLPHCKESPLAFFARRARRCRPSPIQSTPRHLSLHAPRLKAPRAELTLRSSRFRISVRKCQFDPEMARSPLVRPAISGLNWQFLPFRPPTGSCSLPFRPSTGTYFGKSKKMEDQALSNTGKARDAGGKPWEFGKTREAVGLKQHKKATADVNPFPVGNISGLCWISVGKLRGRAASGAFFMPGARNRRAAPWQEIRSQ